MKNPFKIDDSLIISRLEQKELSIIKPSMKADSQFFLLMGKVSLKPFINNMPINMELKLQLMGDKIIQCQADFGYFHQDLENSLSSLSFPRAVLALERLEPERPIFYQVALIEALEELLGLPADPNTHQRYGIAMEFARIEHHLKVCHNVFSAINDKFLPHITQMKMILDEPMRLSRKISEHVPKNGMAFGKVEHLLGESFFHAENLHALILEDKKFMALKKKAALSLSTAASLGLSGLYTRANRNNYDLRKTSRFYRTAIIPTTEGGDAWSRLILRILDIEASIKWLKKTITNLEKDNLELNSIGMPTLLGEPIERFSLGEVSGPEGDIRVNIFTSSNPKNQPIFRIRSPAYFIAQALPEMLLGLRLHELPAILHSFGIRAEEVDK